VASLQTKINVFLLAGNRLFRESLVRILKSKTDIFVVGSAPCTSESVEQIEASDCDVLLVDPMNGDRSDLPFVQEVARSAPRLKLVLIDMVDDESTFLRAVRAGAVGYVLQNASALDIVEAVRSVHTGEAVCPPRLCLSLFKYAASSRNPLPHLRAKSQMGLTRREQQLVPLIAQGYTNKEIASHLHLSEQTVKNHIHRILQRIGASDRLAVAEIIREQNLPV
jgi:DNA-binding NarL/FixJ family response regulator